MKLLDKYMLRTFFVPFGYCISAFTLIYIIFDLFDNLGQFRDGKTPVTEIFFYYVMLVPTFIIYILPISLLLGVLGSLSTLTKSSELTAMRASGQNLIRLVAPYIAIGIIASLGLLAINETITPKAMFWCDKFKSEQNNADKAHISRVLYFATKSDRIWLINAFDSRDFTMKNVEITQRRPDGTDAYKLKAESGRWMDEYWIFNNIEKQSYDEDGTRLGLAEKIEVQEMYEFHEKPADFLLEIKSKKSEYLSCAEIRDYLDNNQLPPEMAGRWMVDFHARLAMPWTCLIVMLLGIPFGNQTGRKGALMGFVLSIGLFVAYYVLINIGISQGKLGHLSPVVAGWLPHLIFLPAALYMIYRIR